MPDKYDEAIAYFTDYPDDIFHAYCCPPNHPHGCLFAFVTPTGKFEDGDRGGGCLVQIVHYNQSACTLELTEAIRADDRIPDDYNITVADLPVFAEWQRHIDKTIRTPGEPTCT